jgi:hypothetical protein
MELYQASHQWATRPADERFRTLEDARAATKHYAEQAVEAEADWSSLRVEPQGADLVVTGETGAAATLTHWATGQLCRRAEAPASYIRTLTPALAAENLNYGLAANRPDGTAQLLLHQNGSMVLRSLMTEKYTRVWNWEVLDRLIEVSARTGLVPARSTFNWSGEALAEDRDVALYASDHDMFSFLMSPDKVLIDPLGKTLHRGVIVTNSEVGDSSLGIMGFYFRDLCANHIIWDAEQLVEVRLAHVGQVRQKWADATAKIRRYMDGAASLAEAKFTETFHTQLGTTKDEVLDTLFGIRSLGISRKLLAASYDAVVPDEDGAPNTVYGMAQGMTRHSQTLGYADERTQVDRAAGRLLKIKF